MNATLESDKCEKQAFNYSGGKVRSLAASSTSLGEYVSFKVAGKCEKLLFTQASWIRGQIEAKSPQQPKMKPFLFLCDGCH